MKKTLSQASLALLLCLFAFSCGKDDPTDPVDTTGPKINSFSPTSGTVGTTIWITGTNFGATTAANTVKIGTVTAPISSASTSEIFVTVPEGAQTGAISVTAGGKTDTAGTFTVTVAEPDPTTVSLDQETLELKTLDKDQLVATVAGAGANETVVWSSDNEEAAIVDQEGNITATGAGTATITATVDGVTASCAITVNPGIIVGGITYDGNYYHAALWINGVLQELSTSANFLAPSVDISNGNIYVAYSDYNDDDVVMTVLKNGNPMSEWDFGPWTEEGKYTRASTAIDVVGSDVYISGFVGPSTQTVAVSWKNGVEEELFVPFYFAESKDLVVKNGTVYTAFYYYGGAYYGGYFINNDGIHVQNTEPNIVVSSIDVDESNNVIVAGTFNNIARVWKNGALLYDLNNGNDTFSEANAVASFGNNTIVVGDNNSNNSNKGNIWLNGQLVQEFNGEGGSGRANDVVIYGDKAYVTGYKYPNPIVLVLDANSGEILDEIILPSNDNFSKGYSIMVK